MQESRTDAQALRSALDKLVESDYKKMGDNVHRFRVLQRMTQDSLAERCLLSAPYISQIERADLYKGVTYQTIIQIAHALGVPACILIAREPCNQYLNCLAKISTSEDILQTLSKELEE